MLVENAFYMCKPPERPARVAKQRPRTQEYTRHLVYLGIATTPLDKVNNVLPLALFRLAMFPLLIFPLALFPLPLFSLAMFPLLIFTLKFFSPRR